MAGLRGGVGTNVRNWPSLRFAPVSYVEDRRCRVARDRPHPLLAAADMRFSPLARRTAVGLTLSALVVGVGAALPRRNPEELLGQVMTLVRDRYAASEVTDVYAAAARGLVRELGDPYSQLLSPKELEDFSPSTLG